MAATTVIPAALFVIINNIRRVLLAGMRFYSGPIQGAALRLHVVKLDFLRILA
jgi:hypothetical protein